MHPKGRGEWKRVINREAALQVTACNAVSRPALVPSQALTNTVQLLRPRSLWMAKPRGRGAVAGRCGSEERTSVHPPAIKASGGRRYVGSGCQGESCCAGVWSHGLRVVVTGAERMTCVWADMRRMPSQAEGLITCVPVFPVGTEVCFMDALQPFPSLLREQWVCMPTSYSDQDPG